MFKLQYKIPKEVDANSTTPPTEKRTTEYVTTNRKAGSGIGDRSYRFSIVDVRIRDSVD